MPEVIDEPRQQQVGSADVFRRRLGNGPIAIRRRPASGLSWLVLALLSPYLALRIGYVQKALFAILILDIPFQLGTHLFYRDADAVSGALAGLSISVTTFALFGLYASWFIQTLEHRSHRSNPSSKFNLALLLYLGFTALSLVAARDARLSSFELFLLLQMYLVFFYVANFVRNREDVLFVVFFLLLGCLMESLVMIGLSFASIPSGLWGPIHIRVDTQVNGELTRVGGTVGSPNEAGAYLSLMLSLAISVLFTPAGRRYKLLAATVLAFGSAALIFTFSRGAWVSLVIAIVLFCWLLWRRNGSSLKAPVALLAILLLSCLPFQNAIKARLLTDDNGSAESRIPLMNLAFRIIADNPILGVGSNNFSAVMDGYLTSEFRQGFLYTVHNKYLLVWAEIGFAGLLAYLAFLFGTLRKGWACWKANDRLMSTLALGFTAAIVGNMVHQSVDIFHDRPVTQSLWLVAGLIFAMHGMLRAQPTSLETLSSIT